VKLTTYFQVEPKLRMRGSKSALFLHLPNFTLIISYGQYKQCNSPLSSFILHLPRKRYKHLSRQFIPTYLLKPIPVAARPTARRSAADRLLGLRVRIPPGHVCLSLVNVVCCQVNGRRPDPSSRAVLPTVYLSLSVNRRNNNALQLH
jgi:hypothetical protein